MRLFLQTYLHEENFALCQLIITVDIKNPDAAVRVLSVVPPGIEPGTQGFSVLCSTN